MDYYPFKKHQIMDQGEFESLTRRCWIGSWELENTFSPLLFAALFQIWNRNYHCYLQNIIHPGSESSSKDADYLRMISCFDIVDHKRPVDLNGSSGLYQTQKDPEKQDGQPVLPSRSFSYKICWTLSDPMPHFYQHSHALYLLVFHVLRMSFKQFCFNCNQNYQKYL